MTAKWRLPDHKSHIIQKLLVQLSVTVRRHFLFLLSYINCQIWREGYYCVSSLSIKKIWIQFFIIFYLILTVFPWRQYLMTCTKNIITAKVFSIITYLFLYSIKFNQSLVMFIGYQVTTSFLKTVAIHLILGILRLPFLSFSLDVPGIPVMMGIIITLLYHRPSVNHV